MRLLLCCTAALLLAACITPDWTPRKRAAAECPNEYLHYCMPKQEMERILRSHQ